MSVLLEKEMCQWRRKIQKAQRQYFMGHSFFITLLIRLTSFNFSDCLQIQLHNREDFAKLEYLSACLWSMSLVKGLNENEEQLSQWRYQHP